MKGRAGPHPLDVPLPHDLRAAAGRASRDVALQQFVGGATLHKDRGRRETCRRAFGERYDALRRHAGAIKQHTLDHLDAYLERFIARARESGAIVHAAATAAQANEVCLAVARRHGCRLCVKSKSMVTEETGLLAALETAGVETVETDLGEFILQLDGDAPSHIVTPMIHKDRAAVGRAFARELGVAYTDDPRRLTMIAREHLREKYRRADLGVSGGNFLVADTGSVVLCTNEGNGRFCTGVPRVHVAMVGIEKLVPSMEHLTVFLKLLARSGTAQPLTVYTQVITGPRRPDEDDGPDEVHIILVDNGRTGLLRAESRELLRCIRCGACLNACPVYRTIGGHAYGSVYSGPIGAVITPALRGLRDFAALPHASSLCGACFEACPVHIDIPRHLTRLRAQIVEQRIAGWRERAGMRLWGLALRTAWTYRLAAWAQRLVLRRLARRVGRRSRDSARADAAHRPGAWIHAGPGPLRAWTQERDFPAPAARSFRQWWARERGHARAPRRDIPGQRGTPA